MKTVEDENIYSNLAEFVLSDLGLIYRYKAPEPPTLTVLSAFYTMQIAQLP
jgi:hypothetical protein